jgi:alkylation response protein AidB-like acyl-CoA dehydrogenase
MIEEDEIVERTRALVADFPPSSCEAGEFLGAQFDRGLAWVNHPVGMGGLDADVRLQAAANHVIEAAGGPDAAAQNPIGHGMCAPTLVAWGTDAQRTRLLRPMFTGEEIWCQLFSEPGAGSDIAGLATRAARTESGWVVSGQKVWTTMAHRSRWGLLIARSDSAVAKHAGLTAFVVDMQAPGVEVRPLYQITGEAEFNEVFFDDVVIPDECLLGPVGGGWGVVVTTLMNERVSIGGGIPQRGDGPIKHLIEAFDTLRASDPTTAGLYRDEVVALWIRAETVRLSNIRMAQQRRPGDPGPEGSIGKILSADLNKDIYAELLRLLGGDGMLYGTYERVRPSNAMEYSTPQKAFLRSRANSIEGGTTEVMRNVLAERMLRLPPEPRADKDVPWNAIPRS